MKVFGYEFGKNKEHLKKPIDTLPMIQLYDKFTAAHHQGIIPRRNYKHLLDDYNFALEEYAAGRIPYSEVEAANRTLDELLGVDGLKISDDKYDSDLQLPREYLNKFPLNIKNILTKTYVDKEGKDVEAIINTQDFTNLLGRKIEKSNAKNWRRTIFATGLGAALAIFGMKCNGPSNYQPSQSSKPVTQIEYRCPTPTYTIPTEVPAKAVTQKTKPKVHKPAAKPKQTVHEQPKQIPTEVPKTAPNDTDDGFGRAGQEKL